jgi:hypothetical protein
MPSSLNGTGVTFSNATTQSVAWPGNVGTVTSIASGNGLSGGTITGSGTLVVACPTQFSVGSYSMGSTYGTNGTNYTAAAAGVSGGTGTWKCMSNVSKTFALYSGCQSAGGSISWSMYCRVS